MSGSFASIVGDDGEFRVDFIENLGDAHEALEQCFSIIHFFTAGKPENVNVACDLYNFPLIGVQMRPLHAPSMDGQRYAKDDSSTYPPPLESTDKHGDVVGVALTRRQWDHVAQAVEDAARMLATAHQRSVDLGHGGYATRAAADRFDEIADRIAEALR